WTPNIGPVTENVTYEAIFVETHRLYTVTWKNENGTVLATKSALYNTVATYTDLTPTKADDADNFYTFIGWDTDDFTVRGDETFTAVFEAHPLNYGVTFKDEFNEVIYSYEIAHDEVPTDAAIIPKPTKQPTAQYEYVWKGWDPTLPSEHLTTDKEFTATFDALLRKYDVVWLNDDDTVIASSSAVYGTSVSTLKPANPTKESTAEYTYTFAEWEGYHDSLTVVEPMVFKAAYNHTLNEYTVEWVVEGTVVETDTCVTYGAMPIYNGLAPHKAPNGSHTYSFVGWNPSIASITGNTTYTAMFVDNNPPEPDYDDDDYEPTTPIYTPQNPYIPSMLNGEHHYAYVLGAGDNMVHPEKIITRAELASIFFRLLKDNIRDKYLSTANPFEDVDSNAWYNTAISTLYNIGAINGKSAKVFAPTDPITRAECVVLCVRFDELNTKGVNIFDDINGHWAEDYIDKASELGWVSGDENGLFRPNDTMSRAEVIALVNNILHRVPEHEDDLLGSMITWEDNQDKTKWYYLHIQEASNSHDHKFKSSGYEYWTAYRDVHDWLKYER
ncbi:MAG: S-layer homology domain-containing protein, partial [Clostridia bacterium]|nr:S-layer homology domain-containing protein [Clostridia bacterium]